MPIGLFSPDGNYPPRRSVVQQRREAAWRFKTSQRQRRKARRR
jgi:hypothetical protein